MSAPLARTSDLVRDSQLRTTISAGLTHHSYYISNPESRRGRTRAEETWRRGRELGNGTFGRVWLEACEAGPKRGQLRALKEIPKDRTQSSSIDYGRELEAIAKFSHDKYVHCFVRSFGWYESHEAVFIAMEYLEHGDLQKHLSVPFSEPATKEIIAQIAEGLLFMHDNEFAHRDLKPANILVVRKHPDWWVKIGDFGISKRADVGSALRTLVGTQGYLAPELIGIFPISESQHSRGESEKLSYTASVDIWALGEMTVRMLAQRSTFTDPRDLFNYVVHETPFPRQILDGLDVQKECYDFVQKTMAASPSKRLQAKQVVSHPWLEASRPSSRASSRRSDMFVDASSIPHPHLMPIEFQTGGIDTTASAQWSTVSDLGALSKLDILEPSFASTEISTTSETLASSQTTQADIHSIDEPTITAQPDGPPFSSTETDILKLAQKFSRMNPEGTRQLTESPQSDTHTTVAAKAENSASPGYQVNSPPAPPKPLGLHAQRIQKRVAELLGESEYSKTTQAALVSQRPPETTHSSEEFSTAYSNIKVSSTPTPSTEGESQSQIDAHVNPQAIVHIGNHALSTKVAVNEAESSLSGLEYFRSKASRPETYMYPPKIVQPQLLLNMVVLDPENVLELVAQCTIQLKERALDHPFIILPHRPNIETSVDVNTFVRLYFSDVAPRGDDLRRTLQALDPLIVAAILKWCWARIRGGVVGWAIYNEFKSRKKLSNTSNFPFLNFVRYYFQRPARQMLIFHFFDLLCSIAAHAKSNGLGGRKLIRMAGWWAFELDETKKDFDQGYQAWLAAADATSYLFHAYLQDQNLSNSENGISRGLVHLGLLLEKSNDRHEKSQFNHGTSKFQVKVDKFASTPFGILQRVVGIRHGFSGNQYEVLQKLSEPSDLAQGLHDECRRVLMAISKNTELKSSLTRSWDRFIATGFPRTDSDTNGNLSGTGAEVEDLGPVNAIKLQTVKLDDTFWWVWMQSQALEETALRREIFGRIVLAETKFQNQWLICEETLSEEFKPAVHTGIAKLYNRAPSIIASAWKRR